MKTGKLMVYTDNPWRKEPKKKYKARDPKLTSVMMSAVKSKGSKAETAIRKELWKRGYRYRLHVKKLVGKPDLVFRKYKTLVFIDGDFWHGRALLEEGVEGLKRGLRTERSEWWIAKLKRTVKRDQEVTKKLISEGWCVLRYWESEVLKDVKAIADKVENHLII